MERARLSPPLEQHTCLSLAPLPPPKPICHLSGNFRAWRACQLEITAEATRLWPCQTESQPTAGVSCGNGGVQRILKQTINMGRLLPPILGGCELAKIFLHPGVTESLSGTWGAQGGRSPNERLPQRKITNALILSIAQPLLFSGKMK